MCKAQPQVLSATTTRSQVSCSISFHAWFAPGLQGKARSPWPSLPLCGGRGGPVYTLCRLHQLLLAFSSLCSASAFSLLVASYEDRVTFSPSGISFSTVTRKDTGTYTCMVSEDNGNNYGEVTIQLTVLGTCTDLYEPEIQCFPDPAKLWGPLMVRVPVVSNLESVLPHVAWLGIN